LTMSMTLTQAFLVFVSLTTCESTLSFLEQIDTSQ